MHEVALGGYTPPEKICRSKSTNQFGERNERLPDLCFSICRFSQVVFIPRAQPHAQSLFLFPFPIVFGINLIHFFNEKKDGAAGNSIVCFADSIPCHAICEWCEFYEECELFRRVQRFWQRKVWTQRHSRWERQRCKFLSRKSAKLFANTKDSKVQIIGKEKCKAHRQL